MSGLIAFLLRNGSGLIRDSVEILIGQDDGAYGALFEQGSPAALAQAIVKYANEIDALREKAETGRAALAQRFGAEAFWRAFTAELGGGSV